MSATATPALAGVKALAVSRLRTAGVMAALGVGIFAAGMSMRGPSWWSVSLRPVSMIAAGLLATGTTRTILLWMAPGGLMNFAAVAANGWRMPVSPYAARSSLLHVSLEPAHRLVWLCDILPRGESLGDQWLRTVVICACAIWVKRVVEAKAREPEHG